MLKTSIISTLKRQVKTPIACTKLSIYYYRNKISLSCIINSTKDKGGGIMQENLYLSREPLTLDCLLLVEGNKNEIVIKKKMWCFKRREVWDISFSELKYDWFGITCEGEFLVGQSEPLWGESLPRIAFRKDIDNDSLVGFVLPFYFQDQDLLRAAIVRDERLSLLYFSELNAYGFSFNSSCYTHEPIKDAIQTAYILMDEINEQLINKHQ